jgi:NTE family protein
METRVGLVLGGGGVVGAAYHAGALSALEHDLGWDARTAEVIVGTSAGALIGALLRTGVPATDLAAWTVGAPLSPDGYPIANALHPEFDPISMRTFLRMPRVPHPTAVWSAVRKPHRFDPMRALMTHLADGDRVLTEYLQFLGHGWPDRSLFLTAVARRDGRRVVFGRDRVPGDGLESAVAASCSVPGYFAPVVVDGSQYIDGGVASPTNADVLRGVALDLVIIVSPMTTSAPLPRYSIERVMRDRSGWQLKRERDRLAPTPTLVMQPGAEVLEHVTADLMNEEHVNDIVGAAFLETGGQLREASCAELLAPLRVARHAAA